MNSLKGYIENLKDSLTSMQKYNDIFENLSQIIFKKLKTEKGKVIIVTTGSMAIFSETLVNGLKSHFKYDNDKIEVISPVNNSNFPFEKEIVENENVTSIGVVIALEKKLTKDDLVIAISSTGRTNYINGFVKEALITEAKIAYLASPVKESKKDRIPEGIDFFVPLILVAKNLNGLHVGNHTTLLKTALEKILFRAFELMGQIKDNNILTTNTWTVKLKENSIPTIKKYKPELTDEQIMKMFEEADNELSTIIASIILNTNFEEAKNKIKELNYDFNKLL